MTRAGFEYILDKYASTPHRLTLERTPEQERWQARAGRLCQAGFPVDRAPQSLAASNPSKNGATLDGSVRCAFRTLIGSSAGVLSRLSPPGSPTPTRPLPQPTTSHLKAERADCACAEGEVLSNN